MTLMRDLSLSGVILSSLVAIQPLNIEAATLTSQDAAVIAQSTFMDSDLLSCSATLSASKQANPSPMTAVEAQPGGRPR